MNVLQRFSTTVEAALHDLFDKKERKNPIAMLNQYVRQAEKETAQVGKLVVRQSELKQKLSTEVRQVTEKLAKREEQLQLAVLAEEQDLVDFANQEVESYKQRLAILVDSEQEATNEYIRLEQQFELMKHRLEDMKVRQLQLMSKENVTHANYRMQEVTAKQANLHANSFDDALSYLDRLAFNVDKQYETTTLEQRLTALEHKK